MKFPSDETGRMRKLAWLWHGPYRVVRVDELDVTVEKVYEPQGGPIQVHQTQVTPCPDKFPVGRFWYGDRALCLDTHPVGWIDY